MAPVPKKIRTNICTQLLWVRRRTTLDLSGRNLRRSTEWAKSICIHYNGWGLNRKCPIHQVLWGMLENRYLLVTMPETERKNRYLLTVQDRFTRFASAYPISNKEAGTVYLDVWYVNILMFSVYQTRYIQTMVVNIVRIFLWIWRIASVLK